MHKHNLLSVTWQLLYKNWVQFVEQLVDYLQLIIIQCKSKNCMEKDKFIGLTDFLNCEIYFIVDSQQSK